ncbi:MAG: hypothetical protein LBP19_06060 [Treponema sp.]|nr:hypothetical protein [Treponema sp.]
MNADVKRIEAIIAGKLSLRPVRDAMKLCRIQRNRKPVWFTHGTGGVPSGTNAVIIL